MSPDTSPEALRHQALAICQRALGLEDSARTRALFVQTVLDCGTAVPPWIRGELLRAMREAWCRPADLAPAAMAVVRADPAVAGCLDRAREAWPRRLGGAELFGPDGLAALEADDLLQEFLAAAMAASMELEWFLVMARAALLELSLAPLEGPLRFPCALARQCFLNEYVYALDEGEEERAETLAGLLDRAIADGAAPARWIAAAASYFPLERFPWPAELPPVPEPLGGLLRQQVLEPRRERALRAAISVLTPVTVGVSSAVRAQYEENPYPRWTRVAAAVQPLPFDAFLARELPCARFRTLGKTGEVDLLVAGCGTGLHPIETGQRIQGARILAVDLSLASLAFAQRQAEELGARDITFAQADILRLGDLDRRFDVIESVGVLHHMEQPLAGLDVLVALLRPGGFLKLGLYSRRARLDIHAARAVIARDGLAGSAADIRGFRAGLMTRENILRYRGLMTSLDFYGASPCRDHLFHVREHVFDIPDLQAALDRAGLRFLGFQLPPASAQGYAARFPQDTTRTDLAGWDAYETEHPSTFQAMYQFWAQRP